MMNNSFPQDTALQDHGLPLLIIAIASFTKHSAKHRLAFSLSFLQNLIIESMFGMLEPNHYLDACITTIYKRVILW